MTKEHPMDRVSIIDGDGHVLEDLPALAKFLPFESFRAAFPPLDHLHTQGHRTAPGSFRAVNANGWVEFMDDIGIERAVVYPTVGLSYGQIVNPQWAIAATRAYNNWLHDAFLSKTPRLKGMALVPLQDPTVGAEELRRAVAELGYCGAMLPSNGLADHIASRAYWPVYDEANRLGCAVGIHGGCHNNLGMDHLNLFAPIHALGHPFGLMVCFASVVFNGLFDRFPNVRWGFLEGGVGWLSMCLERFDRSSETFFDYDPEGQLLKLEPGERVSDYVRRQIKSGRLFVGCEGPEATLADAVRLIGSEAFLFSSDFPHEVDNAYCKGEIDELLEHDGLTDADKHAILRGNAQRFYGLSD